MRNLVLIALLMWSAVQVHAGGDHEFTWNHEKAEVGQLTVTTTESDEGISVDYKSEYVVNISVELKNVDNWSVIYSKESGLTSFDLKNEVNGRKRLDIQEGASDAGVSRVVNGKTKQLDRGKVDYSYVMLFVKEPVGVMSLYSELYGEEFQVRETGKHSYTVTDSRNRRHKFNYNEEGKLEKAEIVMSMGTFTLLPR